MEHRNIKDLKKLPNNPRIIKDEQFQQLVQSIKDDPEYFEARPLILSDRTGDLVIIAGNQRFEAAKELGMKEVPTFLLSKLTKKKEERIILKDNINNGEFDWDILANEWDEDLLEKVGLKKPDKIAENEEVPLDNGDLILKYIGQDAEDVRAIIERQSGVFDKLKAETDVMGLLDDFEQIPDDKKVLLMIKVVGNGN